MKNIITIWAICILFSLHSLAQKSTALINFAENDTWTGNPALAISKNFAYVLYTDSENFKGKICRYNMNTGKADWSNELFETCAKDDPSHNDASIIIDGDGYLHVWIGMHNHSMKYYRSIAPGDFKNFKNFSSELPFNDYGRTYPWVTSTPNGDVFMISRRTAGVYDEKQDLYHWHNNQKKWTMKPIAAKPADCAYMATIHGDENNNVHIIIAWADEHKGDNKFQIAMYMRYDVLNNTYYKADGSEIKSIPLSYDSPEADLPYTNKFEWGIGPEIQTPRIMINDKNQPVISYAYTKDNGKNWINRISYWNGKKWNDTDVMENAHTYGRPPITFTAGQINLYMTDATNNNVFLSSSKDLQNFKTILIAEKELNKGKMALKYNENTDLFITTNRLFKIEY